MAAATYNLFIEQGATRKLRVTVTQGTPAVPVDLTDYIARLGIKSKITDASTVLLLDSAAATALGSTLTLGGAAGTIDIEFTDDETEALVLVSNKGVYDLIIESPDDTATRLLKGAVTFDPGVTPVP